MFKKFGKISIGDRASSFIPKFAYSIHIRNLNADDAENYDYGSATSVYIDIINWGNSIYIEGTNNIDLSNYKISLLDQNDNILQEKYTDLFGNLTFDKIAIRNKNLGIRIFKQDILDEIYKNVYLNKNNLELNFYLNFKE